MNRTDRLGLDSAERTLTSEEQAERERLRPALQAWTAYLNHVGAWPGFDEAEAARAPIVARHRGEPVYKPLIVCPTYALHWARTHGMGGLAGTGTILTYGAMVDALDYMRATRYRSFRPMHDPGVDRRRRDGYFRVTSTVHERLRQSSYVPSLATLSGRKVVERLPRTAARAARPVPVDDAGRTLALLRHYLRATAPTAILATALEQARPLVARSAGRPPVGGSARANLRCDDVLVHAGAVALHAQAFADPLGLPPLTRGEVVAMLRAYAAANPQVVAVVDRFSTADAGQRRKVRDWWRVNLAAVGLPDLDAVALAEEIEHWRWLAERGDAVGREPTPAGRAVAATGRDPVSGVPRSREEYDAAVAAQPELVDLWGGWPLT